MLAASVYFLSTFSRSVVEFLPLAGFLLAGFVLLRTAERFPAFAIGATLLLYFWLKRYTFVPSSLWLPFGYVTVGLSYILFRLLHLIIEARNDAQFRAMPARIYLSYLIGFNTLVAGPIQLYDEYVEDEASAKRPALNDVGEGIERIVVGLFKTNVLAALIAAIRASAQADLPQGGLQQIPSGALLFGLYPLFLYCNFAGYIDIVIGLSRLMGKRLPENFDRPFSSTSFIEFWNRWHITLSRWLRLYVYNPLLVTLMRRFPSRGLEPLFATLAFFVTFFLIGVWHGRTTAFLFFGVLQGGGVAVNKAYQLIMVGRLGRKRYSSIAAHPAYKLVARGVTFTWFAFTLTWFWASWDQAASIWASVAIPRWGIAWIGIFLVSTLVLGAWEAARTRSADMRARLALRLDPLRVKTVWLTTLMVIVVCVVVLFNATAPEIVYKDF
jgi:D-alanyl-lipoteichoic acid acyltransferase DltB (MBOAT superfamily)